MASTSSHSDPNNLTTGKCRIQPDAGGYFKNPFPEFRFLTPFEVLRFLTWEKDNTNLPSDTSIIDKNLPFNRNYSTVNESVNNSVTWIGHASCLLKLSGVHILTDPVFSDYCFAIQFNLSNKTKRFREPALKVDDLKQVDAVVISHNHYDHLDRHSVKDLNKKFPSCQWFVPQGLRTWFTRSGVLEKNVHELTWWEEKAHTFANKQSSEELKFTCVPAQHWSLRTGLDRNYTLWCGWGIKSRERNVYFAGDTGYNNRIFNQIGYHCGPFDLALIPIGAYEPRKFLQCQHVNPLEAVKVHKEVQSKFSLGIHWGTFQLGYEHYMAPPKDLEAALKEANIDLNEFVTFKHGECREF